MKGRIVVDKKTNLTITITGTHVDADGELHAVNAKYEGVDAVFMSAYKLMPGLEVEHNTAIVGGFSRTMWVKMIANIFKEACDDETDVLMMLMDSLKAAVDK